jgi:hypothetical protein
LKSIKTDSLEQTHASDPAAAGLELLLLLLAGCVDFNEQQLET